MTPEQLAKSREEFKEEFKDWRGFLAEDAEGKFINKYTQRMWVGWVRRQESLVVELPTVNRSLCEGDQWHDGWEFGEQEYKDKMIEALQSAGINYREKE